MASVDPTRSAAAKKGWETRRRNGHAPAAAAPKARKAQPKPKRETSRSHVVQEHGRWVLYRGGTPVLDGRGYPVSFGRKEDAEFTLSHMEAREKVTHIDSQRRRHRGGWV